MTARALANGAVAPVSVSADADEIAALVDAASSGELSAEPMQVRRYETDLTRAAALSIPIPEAIELVLLARDIEPPLIVSGLGLTSRDRIAFADPLGTGVDQWHLRAHAAPPDLSQRTTVWPLVRGHRGPNDACHAASWQAGAMVDAE